jgi:hypothetical protein
MSRAPGASTVLHRLATACLATDCLATACLAVNCLAIDAFVP